MLCENRPKEVEAMKLRVKFRGFPHLYKLMKKKKDLELDIPGDTVRSVVDTLSKKYGDTVRKALLDQEGDIDIDFRVVINDQIYVEHGKRMQTLLNEGDSVCFMGPR